ncbi:predicted protein [Botrytis cinerea T4]|uniref:Uncharacterized protein n=1 Tax=Botryotinia fuckeliana (strain T4) TaxID=999810 RepID=G2XW28_BOTF4|nr:predicted protein [Botrytis cinerea T4]
MAFHRQNYRTFVPEFTIPLPNKKKKLRSIPRSFQPERICNYLSVRELRGQRDRNDPKEYLIMACSCVHSPYRV